MPVDFTKASSDMRVSVWLGPSGGATGITDIGEPLAAELNNTGGTSMMLAASPSISWNDFDFGTQASEVNSEPSLADASTYEEFGQANFGGSMSFYYPEEYDDNSNMHSLVYDLTDEPGVLIDAAIRIDGDIETSASAANGQFVSAYRVSGESEANPFTPGESKRRTVGFAQKSEFAHYVVVGPHDITIIAPASPTVGGAGRIRATQGGRDVTNSLQWSTSNGAVLNVHPGGFYEALSAGSATVTATDRLTGDTKTQSITVGS